MNMIKSYLKCYRALRKTTGRGRFDCMIGAWHLYGLKKEIQKFTKPETQ